MSHDTTKSGIVHVSLNVENKNELSETEFDNLMSEIVFNTDTNLISDVECVDRAMAKFDLYLEMDLDDEEVDELIESITFKGTPEIVSIANYVRG